MNNLTKLFEAKHDVPLSNRAERAQEHVQRLRNANATTKEVQDVLEMCKMQAIKVEAAKKALSAGMDAHPDVQCDLFVRAAQIACLPCTVHTCPAQYACTTTDMCTLPGCAQSTLQKEQQALRDANSRRASQQVDAATCAAAHETANATDVNATRENITVPFVENFKYFLKYELLRTRHAHGVSWPEQNGALEMLAQDVLELLISGRGAAGAPSSARCVSGKSAAGASSSAQYMPMEPAQSEKRLPVTMSSSKYIVPTTQTMDKRCVHGFEHFVHVSCACAGSGACADRVFVPLGLCTGC